MISVVALVCCIFPVAAAVIESVQLRGASVSHFQRRLADESGTKIVGGQEASLNAHPSFVQWGDNCGGVLIHDDIVISASHCNFVANSIGRCPLYVGGNGTQNSGTRMYASAAFKHPRYDSENSFAYDFLILKLPQRMQGIPFASLNDDPRYPTDGAPLTVVGHGILHEEDAREDAPTVYHEVAVPYIRNCSEFYENVDPAIQFCAGDMPLGGKDTCQGDSGGGIFDENGLLVGIVSWGRGCAQPSQPGVYARISAIERWVAHMICQESDYPPADCEDLKVNITLDDHPEEFGMSLLDFHSVQQPEVVIIPPGSLSRVAPRRTRRYSFSVPKGRSYLLQVEDTGQNGFCCEKGVGEVTVQDGHSFYHLSGDFQGQCASILLPFVGGSDGAIISSSPNSANETHLSILSPPVLYAIAVDVRYQGPSDDTTWKVVRCNTDSTFTTIHEDLPEGRILNDMEKEVQVGLHDLVAGIYELQVGENSVDGGEPRLAGFSVTAIDNEDSSFLSLLYKYRGEAGKFQGRFELGLA
ncbi:Kallikrein 1-related peptidase [Seminavis robusta]|uniref:trypsin n=1 Tax=Seminavis robusta TaxID=568900 RepID=A0A9N8HPE0_9STRA|nr:Kallikrein 1-related peptidase [Seminavis robusta]|eukprot:Sro1079_g238880.1 Kallikrein 1-related peptidase (527) ;mRNA; f:13091-14941